jgi:hypothetical protein
LFLLQQPHNTLYVCLTLVHVSSREFLEWGYAKIISIWYDLGTYRREQKDLIMKNNKRDNTIKNPDDWKTGDEEMTGAQNSYLHTLADEAGEKVNDDLTKAEAAKKIDELQKKTGRGNS